MHSSKKKKRALCSVYMHIYGLFHFFFFFFFFEKETHTHKGEGNGLFVSLLKESAKYFFG